MKRSFRKIWGLSITLTLLANPAYASNDHDFWGNIIRRLNGSKKMMVISSSRETLPTVKIYPKLLSFKGVVEIPAYLNLSSGRGFINSQAAQITYDGQVVCNYSPKTSNSRTYFLVSCSDGSEARDQINVQNKIEVRLNYAASGSAVVKASFKVIRSDAAEYGVVFPYLNASEGQVLSFNGEAWVATDIEELLPDLTAGVQGPVGPQGPAGLTGATGLQGPKGDKGDKGDAGVAGAAGSVGPMGPIGPAGANGLAGAAGSVGPMGPMGPAGANGVAGAAGSVGPMGPAGANGAQGAMGPQGPAGLDGAAGTIGATGAMGPRGYTGAAGADGAPGVAGPQGSQGFPGLPGTDGLQGPAGAVGATGVAGPQGLKGDKGDRGLSEIAYLRDERVSGSHGGTCAAASLWTQRTLNTLGGDISFITLSANRFVLQPGKYFIEVSAPGYAVNAHQAKLRVIESASDALNGSTAFSLSTGASVSHSIISGEIVVAIASTFEVQHRCQSDKANSGFGFAASFGTPEIYTQVKIIKKQ